MSFLTFKIFVVGLFSCILIGRGVSNALIHTPPHNRKVVVAKNQKLKPPSPAPRHDRKFEGKSNKHVPSHRLMPPNIRIFIIHKNQIFGGFGLYIDYQKYTTGYDHLTYIKNHLVTSNIQKGTIFVAANRINDISVRVDARRQKWQHEEDNNNGIRYSRSKMDFTSIYMTLVISGSVINPAVTLVVNYRHRYEKQYYTINYAVFLVYNFQVWFSKWVSGTVLGSLLFEGFSISIINCVFLILNVVTQELWLQIQVLATKTQKWWVERQLLELSEKKISDFATCFEVTSETNLCFDSSQNTKISDVTNDKRISNSISEVNNNSILPTITELQNNRSTLNNVVDNTDLASDQALYSAANSGNAVPNCESIGSLTERQASNAKEATVKETSSLEEISSQYALTRNSIKKLVIEYKDEGIDFRKRVLLIGYHQIFSSSIASIFHNKYTDLLNFFT